MKNLFSDLYETIELRKKSNKKNSYTKKLFKEGEKKKAQKFGEENSKLKIDFLKRSKKKKKVIAFHQMIGLDFLP